MKEKETEEIDAKLDAMMYIIGPAAIVIGVIVGYLLGFTHRDQLAIPGVVIGVFIVLTVLFRTFLWVKKRKEVKDEFLKR